MFLNTYVILTPIGVTHIKGESFDKESYLYWIFLLMTGGREFVMAVGELNEASPPY